MTNLETTYDPDADSLYIQFTKNQVHRTKDYNIDVTVDLDEDGAIVGIEILSVNETFE